MLSVQSVIGRRQMESIQKRKQKYNLQVNTRTTKKLTKQPDFRCANVSSVIFHYFILHTQCSFRCLRFFALHSYICTCMKNIVLCNIIRLLLNWNIRYKLFRSCNTSSFYIYYFMLRLHSIQTLHSLQRKV